MNKKKGVELPAERVEGEGASRPSGDRQPTVRKINDHVWCGQHYCYVDMPDGRRFRIARARTRKGVVEGRIILGSENGWEPITGGRVELS